MQTKIAPLNYKIELTQSRDYLEKMERMPLREYLLEAVKIVSLLPLAYGFLIANTFLFLIALITVIFSFFKELFLDVKDSFTK